MSDRSMSRRDFHKFGAASLATAVAAGETTPATAAPSNRKRLGLIGVGNRGTQVLNAFLTHPDVEVAAVCDVFEPYLKRAQERLGGRTHVTNDFRRVLDRKDVDAVVIATPDHWHAVQTILACQAGKDVYVEKPLSITIREGRRMVEAARKHGRVVQVGTHRRSSNLYAEFAGRVQGGLLGKVTVARGYRLSNMFPNGIGKAKPSDPPPGLDWDKWLGPRPWRPFQSTIAPYKFRSWDPYSSQIANWGIHYLDAIRWLLGEEAPASISAHGGRFAIDDDRTIPDTMEAVFEFASGRLVLFGQYEASGNPMLPQAKSNFAARKEPPTLGNAAFEKSAPWLWAPLRDRLYVDELYGATVIAFYAWWARVADWLDRRVWGGIVALVVWLTGLWAHFNRFLDNNWVNGGFDKTCEELSSGGGLLSRVEGGRVQNYLRILAAAVVVLAAILLWSSRP